MINYIHKEHILLTHPWIRLKSTAEEILGVAADRELASEETVSNDMPICPEIYESTESSITKEESSNNLVKSGGRVHTKFVL